MKRIFGIVLLGALLFSLPAWAKEPLRIIEGIVVKVSDGDTITVDSKGTVVKVRLYGIDAPETEKVNRKTGLVAKPGQPFGEAASSALVNKVSGRQVRLEVMDIDKYRRLVSFLWVGERNINQEMVSEGWAWAYRKYLHRAYASEYLGAETRARAAHKGLWRQGNPQPPWEFRKQMKGEGYGREG